MALDQKCIVDGVTILIHNIKKYSDFEQMFDTNPFEDEVADFFNEAKTNLTETTVKVMRRITNF
jgi:ASC-1-like (ASCH) protein